MFASREYVEMLAVAMVRGSILNVEGLENGVQVCIRGTVQALELESGGRLTWNVRVRGHDIEDALPDIGNHVVFIRLQNPVVQLSQH